jgi:hypothetical protein
MKLESRPQNLVLPPPWATNATDHDSATATATINMNTNRTDDQYAFATPHDHAGGTQNWH